MKILAAKFILEANAHVPMKCDLANVALSFAHDALTHMQLNNVFDAEDITLIPVLCADAGCSGVMKKTCFDYIEATILNAIQENLHDLDGIYLHLHGASYVEEIGSGEHHLLASIRNIVASYMPIAIVCDPHGNLTQTYVEQATLIRSYREAPHIDIAETIAFVGSQLVSLIRSRKHIVPVYRKLPLILGGEQSVSKDEPVCSINEYMNELEKDERILSVSWHVGYLRHDCPEAGCGIVVIPSDSKHQSYAFEIADQLADYIFAKRHEFHYTGCSVPPEEALQMAIEVNDKPVFITDSGDNVTSGAMGANTTILRQVLARKDDDKRFLFASINDEKTYKQLRNKAIGEKATIQLGMEIDDLSAAVTLDVVVKFHGRQAGTIMYGEKGDYGGLVTVSVEQHAIDIVITDNNHSFVEVHQITACGTRIDEYDIIVVKQGYIHPELAAKGKLCIMSLTDGATLQDTRRIPFKRIMRPMYPIDEI